MRNTMFRSAAFGLALLGLASVADAQQSTGNIYGEAKAGDTVLIDAPVIGVHREVTLTEDGRYRVSRLPIGSYYVVVRHPDGTTDAPKGIAVRAGTTSRVK